MRKPKVPLNDQIYILFIHYNCFENLKTKQLSERLTPRLERAQICLPAVVLLGGATCSCC